MMLTLNLRLKHWFESLIHQIYVIFYTQDEKNINTKAMITTVHQRLPDDIMIICIHNKMTINAIIQPVLLQIIIDTIDYFSYNKDLT